MQTTDDVKYAAQIAWPKAAWRTELLLQNCACAYAYVSSIDAMHTCPASMPSVMVANRLAFKHVYIPTCGASSFICPYITGVSQHFEDMVAFVMYHIACMCDIAEHAEATMLQQRLVRVWAYKLEIPSNQHAPTPGHAILSSSLPTAAVCLCAGGRIKGLSICLHLPCAEVDLVFESAAIACCCHRSANPTVSACPKHAFDLVCKCPCDARTFLVVVMHYL